jgi:hypothetical protein
MTCFPVQQNVLRLDIPGKDNLQLLLEATFNGTIAPVSGELSVVSREVPLAAPYFFILLLSKYN